MISRIPPLMVLTASLVASPAYPATWYCPVFPPEQKVEVDPQSGAKVIFVTTHSASDSNFYFHERCFLWNNRMLLFNSERFGRSEVMAYLLDTGELTRLTRPQDPNLGSRVASVNGDRLYAVKAGGIYEWRFEITRAPGTAVRVTERRLTDLPEGAEQRSSLDENCDGSLLTFAYRLGEDHYIGFYDLAAATLRPPAKLDFKPDHLQFHRHRSNLVSMSRTYETGGDWAPLDPPDPLRARVWTLNVQTRQPIPAFYQVPGELATHECWWVNDQMTFVGGFHHEGNREEGTVKVLDFKTGDIRIIGAGAWLDGVPAAQLSQVNWWHASGSPNGKWVVADNWHGTVALFNARTTQPRILTTGHRVYGSKGLHAHAGWDLKGEYVEFTSNKLGNPDVCLVAIPGDW
ncbi:MAG: hypothetical protein KJ072_17545 [Verrucomicrobia bacterium]|nr:hypothetical protein [Verrucomicrobiota bacterium]